MISDNELNELISVPKEWRNGDDKIQWPKFHDKFNLEWLETLWKYLGEYCKNDLSMMENFNIIYAVQSVNSIINRKLNKTKDITPVIDNSKNLTLFKLSKNSNLIYTPIYSSIDNENGKTASTSATTTDLNNKNETLNVLSEETYTSLIKILTKLGFECIDSISNIILAHPLFHNYVPNLRTCRYNLLRAFRNKYKNAPMFKLNQDFNTYLNDVDIKLLQQFLSKLEISSSSSTTSNQANCGFNSNSLPSFINSNNNLNNKQSIPSVNIKEVEEEQSLIDMFKDLPIFENSAFECKERYLSLKDALFIYETPIRLPFELPGIKPFIIVQDNESKLLIIEKLNLKLVKDFSFIIKEIVKYCTSKELNSLPPIKVHSIGKWLLLNCASYLLANFNSNDTNNSNKTNNINNSKSSSDLIELIKNAKLFFNQNNELCAAYQFINPMFKERFIPILETKCLPAKDLMEEKCISILKELKMRNCLQLKVDEIIDLYENSVKQTDVNRRLLAELIIEILINRLQDSKSNSLDSTTSIEKVLNEYSASKAVTLRHFLMSVSWIPLQRERPQSYPQSLSWKGSESLTTNGSGISTSTLISAASTSIKFSSPRECVDSAFAYCVGSVACVSDLEIPIDLKSYIDLKQVHLDIVVRHLKLTTKCFESSALKVEWYDYLTVSKRCYEFMSTCDPQDIIRELKANDLNEWIWNGAGFSSISSIFIITEKDHPLCSHVAVLPFELYVFVKFFERLGIKKQPDSKQLEQILNKCVKNSQKLMMLSSTAPVAAASTAIKSPLSPVSTSDQNQMFLENAAKNFPLINWIKAYYSTEKKLQAIIKDYEENLINVNSSLGTNGTIHTNGTTSSAPFITSANGQSPTSKSPVSDPKFVNSDSITGVENSSDYIFLYLPETYKSPEIKDNLLNSVLTLVKNKQIKILDEEAYLMRKVAVAAAASVAAAAATTASSSISSSTSSPTTSIQNPLSSGVSKNQIYNIFDHYRVYNEIILPNLNSLSKNVKDAVVLFALDHADPKMLEILRDHPCIPVLPYGRRLKKPNKLVHPMGKIAPLYLDSDERFPCGSEETYLREDRLQILKILGMRCDSLNWLELIERAESISKIREYDLAIERSIVILSILNEKLANSNILLNVNGQSNNQQLNGSATPQHIETKEEKESRFNACELIRDISFIPVKTKPYQKLNLTWYGDKFKLRFAKPRELLSGTYENLCSCFWPIPLYEYKRKEKIITKQIEQFFGIDDLMSKFTLRDALNQLEEVCKINLQEIDDSKEVKLITDMCFQIYEYIQSECQKRPAELIPVVREFFSEKKCILLNEEFISVNQLCWHLSVNLKSMFYQIPTAFLRSLKYLFNQVLNVRVNLDLPDLLHVVDSMKKKYKDTPVVNRDDFNMLMNVYGLMIDQGYQIITNLYLPNINGILLPGRVLFFHPLVADHLDKPEEYVHPAVDRRICIIAGCLMNKKLSNQENGVSLNGVQPQIIQQQQQQNNQSSSSFSNGRIFPRVFGNKRLEGILARLDDDKIDPNLVNSIDEGNPQIIIDYLLEANRIHSLSAFLSEDDIFVILKYFNDFLARNYQAGTFQRLKELKIYKPLWCDKYISLSSIHIPSSSPNIFSAPGINVLPLNPQQQQVPNVFLISDEMSSLMKRSFKLNPFVQKLQSTSDLNSNVPCTILVRRQELHKLYTHLSLINLNDLDAFISLCLPQFRKIDAKCQNNFLKYLYEEIMEKSYIHEKEKCFKVLREKLYLQTRKGDQQLICDLYDMKNETLKNILNDSFFPDESFDSPQCLRFLKEAGLRTHLPSDLCKKCMNEIEMKVTGENSNAEQQQNSTTTSTTTSGWTDELRTRSKWLYQHLIENWQRFDDSVLQQRFLEPYCSAKQYIDLKQPFEYNEFNKTCLKLSDAELQKYELLVWSSSYILPSFVKTETMESNAIEFLKLNRKPCFAIVNQHLNNICESVGSKTFIAAMNGIPDLSENIAAQDETLIEILGKIYQYLDDLHSSEHHKDMYKQLEDKEIVWSSSTRKFISPNKICIQLDIADEIPPFLYSLTPSLKTFRNLLLRLGAKDKPYPMLYGDILRKMAKVCGDDYLNSNELCKAIKAMECFFKYLKLNNLKTDSNDLNSNGPNTENVTAQFKLPGLYFVTTELKLEKSSNCVILDNRDNLDDLAKLPQDKFVFNPSEKVFKISTNEIKPLIDKIFISQRPTLFSQKYEATYDFTLPDDPDSQRQNLLTSLERKYQQIFTSRQLHRCLARCISNEEARRSSPKHLPIDEVEKVIRERLSSIKVTCVEYLETSLSYRKLSQQQKLEQTVEEKACYLTHESLQFATLYVSKKHIEQPYFALCLARALQPLLIDLHFDHSIFTSLIATSVSQMSRLLQLVNVATEENILSVIKLQYVPSSGKLYGDDVNLLAPYDPKLHNVLIGDLCVFANSDGTYIYCQIVKINVIHSKSSKYTSSFKTETKTDNFDYEFTVQIDDNGTQLVKILQKDLYVLENWHRIYDAMTAKPPDERETFKYQESSSSSTKNNNTTNNNNNENDSNGKRETNEDNNSGNASDSSDKSDTSSNYGSSEQLPNAVELEQAKSEINQELRLLWSLEENERKKKINRLLLKWHPDKNPGKEKFASEVFKHLKKQIEFYKTDPFMAGFYRSTYSSYGGFNPSSTTNNSTYGTGSTTGTEDYKSKHYGSFDDLHRKSGSPGGSGSPHSSPSRESGPTGSSFDYDAKGPGPSNLGRTGSFRQEWERRRQQKRQTTGTDPS
jgi:hypothetical protein